MKLMFATEYWREELADAIDTAEREAGVTLDHLRYDDIAQGLRSRVVARLFEAGVHPAWCYQQSVGAGAIVQAATEAELAAFHAALDAESEWLAREVHAEVASEKETREEVSDE
jgi:hypothetical protein